MALLPFRGLPGLPWALGAGKRRRLGMAMIASSEHRTHKGRNQRTQPVILTLAFLTHGNDFYAGFCANGPACLAETVVRSGIFSRTLAIPLRESPTPQASICRERLDEPSHDEGNLPQNFTALMSEIAVF
jgi:hypothetical protein